MMMPYLKLLLLLPFFALYLQLYNYATIRKGTEKQQTCRALGIFSCTIGTLCLISRDYLPVIIGLLLLMFGFRFIAHSLDRLDKKIFIDRYDNSAD